MKNNRLTIATRESPLALWQARHVAQLLEQAHPGIEVVLYGMTTKGDQILNSPLAKIGGKGLFVKELEVALLDGRADIAVHSMKDVPMEFPEGLHLAVILAREDPRDAFVSGHYSNWEALPQGAKVGTSSLRRQCQLAALRPDLQILDLRGNVNTRLAKLDSGTYDAIILASAGLTRLQMHTRIASYLPISVSLPAIGQGAIGIEARDGDARVQGLLAPLNHSETEICVRAERAVNARLQGGCQVPIAGYATLSANELALQALVGSPDGKQILRAQAQASADQALAVGEQVAQALLDQGAAQILQAL